MSYKKNLLPKGWYHATIRQARRENNNLVLVWTIDRGEHVYRNVLEKFSLDEEGVGDLKNKMNEIGYEIYDDYKDNFFFEQFITQDIRSRIHIDRAVVRKVIKNVVLERKLPNKPRDYNVKSRKDERFYNKGNKGKDLPIRDVGKRQD